MEIKNQNIRAEPELNPSTFRLQLSQEMSEAAEHMAEHNWSFSSYYQILSNFYSALSKQETLYFMLFLVYLTCSSLLSFSHPIKTKKNLPMKSIVNEIKKQEKYL